MSNTAYKDVIPPEDRPDGDVHSTSWRARLTLSAVILWTVLSSILIVGLGTGYYALHLLYENKLKDTWAILYLDLEQKGNRLLTRLETLSSYTSEGQYQSPPTHVIKIRNNQEFETIRGDFPAVLSTRELQLDSTRLTELFSILKVSGRTYLTTAISSERASLVLGTPVSGEFYALWRIPFSEWLKDSLQSDLKNTVYLMTREGRVAFTSNKNINDGNAVNRPLVQEFIRSPIHQGQLEFDSPEQGRTFGFFFEVPRSNLLIFVEMNRDVSLAPVREIAVQFSIILVIILTLVGVGLQFPLASILRPMKEMVRLAWQIGEGNFQVRPVTTGFGELNVLVRAFEDMGTNLSARDERIRGLLVEQQEKLRLEGELALAHSIQSNFLSLTNLPSDSGVETVAKYIPAAEVAGDWYTTSYDPETGESVFAVADVSGHGAGSAMFTSIIAALFEEIRHFQPAPFPTDLFFDRLNHLFLRLGRGQMHATILLAKHIRGSGKLQLFNAGHPFPVIFAKGSNEGSIDFPRLGSDYLGLSDAFTPATAEIPFNPGTTLLMFTDGLIESRPDKKVYSEKRLQKVLLSGRNLPLSQLIQKVEKDWKQFLSGQDAQDDVCLMLVRAQ